MIVYRSALGNVFCLEGWQGHNGQRCCSWLNWQVSCTLVIPCKASAWRPFLNFIAAAAGTTREANMHPIWIRVWHHHRVYRVKKPLASDFMSCREASSCFQVTVCSMQPPTNSTSSLMFDQ